MTRWWLCLVVWLSAGATHGQPGADLLEQSQQALAAGDFSRAAGYAEHALKDPRRPTADRAEAYRVLGLARFYGGERAAAKEAFLGYVRLDPEAHLDPALVAPEAIMLLEEVRAERSAELAAARPKEEKQWALNLLPPLGQFQNQQRTKGWILGASWAALLAANISSYIILRSWCDDTGACPDRQKSAEHLRIFNIVTGIGFVGVYGFGIVDGLLGMKAEPAYSPHISLGTDPAGRAHISLHLRF